MKSDALFKFVLAADSLPKREHTFQAIQFGTKLEQMNSSDDAKRGAKFRLGPKYNRRHNSSLEIERALQEKGLKVKAREIWADFQTLGESGHKIIQEVIDDWIYWKDRERPTCFRSFENRVSEIRKRLKQHPPARPPSSSSK